MKIAYGLLKFPQIADTQGYPVAEAHFQLIIGTDDEAAKQLNLAIFFSFFFCWWKKAYMSIDANLVSNPKDR